MNQALEIRQHNAITTAKRLAKMSSKRCCTYSMTRGMNSLSDYQILNVTY